MLNYMNDFLNKNRTDIFAKSGRFSADKMMNKVSVTLSPLYV